MIAKQKNCPALRFPEFQGEWYKDSVANLFDINAGGDIAKEHISEEKTEQYKYPIYANAEKNKGLYGYSDIYKVEANVITIAGRGVNIGIVHARNHRFYPIVRLLVLKPKNESSIYFYEYALNRLNIMPESTGVPQLTAPQISKYELYVPLLSEQQKIADFLSAVDERIQQLTRKKELLEQYKTGVMQQLFSRIIRFKTDEGNDYPDWEEKRLGEVLIEHKTRNGDNMVNEVFSVAKGKGVINQIEHLGRSYAADDISNYKVVYPDDIIYTKSPTSDFPYGIVKQNKTNRTGVVSVLYAVFSPANKYIGYLLEEYFRSWINTYNYLHPIVRRGAKNTMNVSNDDFLNAKEISLPKSEFEQKKIVDLLSGIDDKIVSLQNEIEQTQLFKKGLLQQMFV